MHSSSKHIGLARTVYIYTIYDRIFDDFPAENTVYTPYIYMALANPKNTACCKNTLKTQRAAW
jgi:hypothetical protein